MPTAAAVPGAFPALPTPVTVCPTVTVAESPRAAVARPPACSTWSTATSAVGLPPTTAARYHRPVVRSRTETEVAPAMTWSLVSTRPEAVRTMPVPAASARPWSSVVSTSTTPTVSAAVARVAGRTRDATDADRPGPPAGPAPCAVFPPAAAPPDGPWWWCQPPRPVPGPLSTPPDLPYLPTAAAGAVTVSVGATAWTRSVAAPHDDTAATAATAASRVSRRG